MSDSRRGRQIHICFHGVGEPRRPLEPGEDSYWVGVDQFHSLLDGLREWPDLALSFDDSNQSDLDIALPALLDRGLTASFFVIAGRLEDTGSLGPDDVVALRDAGMTIGSHGMRHRSWRGMGGATTAEELVEARDVLADVVGRPITEAACPLGLYDRHALSSLRSAGYAAVFTSDRRWARHGQWLQPRFSVVSSDSVDSLRRAALDPPSAVRRMRQALVGAAKRLR